MRMSLHIFTDCILKTSRMDQEKSDTVSDASETMNLKNNLDVTNSY